MLVAICVDVTYMDNYTNLATFTDVDEAKAYCEALAKNRKRSLTNYDIEVWDGVQKLYTCSFYNDVKAWKTY